MCSGLFEKDKLLFAFMVAVKIALESGSVPEAEWQLFMVGVVPDEQVLAAKPHTEALQASHPAISKTNWSAAVLLEKEMPACFGDLSDAIASDPDAWQSFFTTETPHTDALPGDYESKLTSFQRLIMLRVLREEKITDSTRTYVGSTIGQSFTESPPFDLEGSYNDSTNVSPLIFILSPGADPTDYLVQLAKAKGKGDGGLRIISLGQGQGPIAEKAIDMAQKWAIGFVCRIAIWPFRGSLSLSKLSKPCRMTQLLLAVTSDCGLRACLPRVSCSSATKWPQSYQRASSRSQSKSQSHFWRYH